MRIMSSIVLLALVIIFFIYRSNMPETIYDKISTGMSISEVSIILKSGVTDPYSCLWILPDEKKYFPTLGCDLPNKNILNKFSRFGFGVVVVFKGVAIDCDFNIFFDKKLTVVSVGNLMTR